MAVVEANNITHHHQHNHAAPHHTTPRAISTFIMDVLRCVASVEYILCVCLETLCFSSFRVQLLSALPHIFAIGGAHRTATIRECFCFRILFMVCLCWGTFARVPLLEFFCWGTLGWVPLLGTFARVPLLGYFGWSTSAGVFFLMYFCSLCVLFKM